MSEGVYYRLGILSGRLRGFELEEDLIKLNRCSKVQYQKLKNI